MKTLSVIQPWATLIAIGAKRLETRTWRPPDGVLGQRVAIHASRSVQFIRLAIVGEFMPQALRGHKMLLGAIVATGTLIGVHRAEVIRNEATRWGKAELAFGDFRPGRWAWEFADVVPVEPAVPCRGRLGLWECLDVLTPSKGE